MSPSDFLKGNCEQCGGRIEFPAEGAGTEVACPHCAQPTALLETLATPAQPPGTLTAVELTAAFGGPIRRPRISVFYQTGLLLVSGVMRRCANLPSEKHWLSVACTAQVGNNAEQWSPATSTSMLAHTLNKYVHA